MLRQLAHFPFNPSSSKKTTEPESDLFNDPLRSER